MKTYSFYSLASGVFSCSVFSGSESAAQLNAPDGYGLIEGDFDADQRRVDLATMQVISYKPPPPSTDDLQTAEWDETLEKWLLKPTEKSLWITVRKERDRRLAQTDWVSLRASETQKEVPAAWLEYRQALRDVTTQSDPLNIDWPVPSDA
jgi:Phage tail assembly chaperone protein